METTTEENTEATTEEITEATTEATSGSTSEAVTGGGDNRGGDCTILAPKFWCQLFGTGTFWRKHFYANICLCREILAPTFCRQDVLDQIYSRAETFWRQFIVFSRLGRLFCSNCS